MKLELPMPGWLDATLISDVPPVLGRAVPPEDRAGGRLRAGIIQSRPVVAGDEGDNELAMFLSAERGRFEYHVVRATFTFVDSEAEPLDSAWVKIDLSSTEEDGDGLEGPIAWSMEPEQLAVPSGVVQTAEIKANAKLFTAGLSRQAAVGDEVYLRSRHSGSTRPTWYLSRTARHPLDGDVDLRLVMRIPARTRALAQVSAGAQIRTKKFGLLPYLAEIPRLDAWQLAVPG